jgi:GT2 family glycosyltransferase/2-polyprenyl-3-methyl-5-hydroxy-6-metoxy-1,4-benzoquinol methylase/tetratricopeptide (TPR) repeat protein
MKILLLQLEFSRWKTAKPWSYTMNFGIAEALRKQGHTTFTIPILPDQQNVEFSMSWLGRAQEICNGMKFDQVWVWLLHYPYNQETLEWIRRIAPVRIGILVESLQYDEEECSQAPIFKTRVDKIKEQAHYLTHVLTSDENDRGPIFSWGCGGVLWWPCGVPEGSIVPFQRVSEHPRAVFHGTLYGKRKTYFSQRRLHGLLMSPTPDMSHNEFQQLFDDIQVKMETTLTSRQLLNVQDLQRFVLMLDQVRQGEFRKWMEHLGLWAVIVNLPSYAKFYGGRVFEGLAAGRPVISWEIPGHPKNNALFQDGEEILLFPKYDVEALANHIERLLSDWKYSRQLVLNAQRQLREFHTVEKRVKDVLQWVTSGTIPSYEMRPEGQVFSLKRQNAPSNEPHRFMDHSIVEDMGMEKGRDIVSEDVSNETCEGDGSVRSYGSQEGWVNMSQAKQRNQEDKFYTDLFVHSGSWSTPTPNTDEALRWEKIKVFLPDIIRQFEEVHVQPIRILDVGCGRGWLTNLLSHYGYCEGIEPVETVVKYGRRLFPNLTLHVGFPDVLLTREDFQPYDLIVTSEVIEHIPHAQKSQFVYTLQQLLKPKGAVILTTPRQEVWEQWRQVSTPNQPIEDWITEPDLFDLFRERGFHELGRERIYFDLPKFQYVAAPSPGEETSSATIIALYQIWAFGTGTFYQDLPNHNGSLTDGGPSEQSFAETFVPIPAHEHAGGSGMSQDSEFSAQSRNPLVSVIVPTFNRRDTLKTALQSIIQQTFTDFEIIVINDAGIDVEDIVASFNARNNVSSIRHGKNRGLAAARNSGLGVARGKYIAYLDDDDRYACHHLETLVSFLEESRYQAAYTDAWQICQRKEQGEYFEIQRSVPYSRDFNRDMLLLTNCFPVLCMMHEKVCLETTGVFDETLTTHEDWDLWIRLSRHFGFAHIKQITAEFTWRMDGSSMTSRIPSDFLRTKRLIYEKYDEYFRLQPHLIPIKDQELRDLESRVNSQPFECSIIIPVFNKLELTQQCLMSLAEVTTGTSYEVVIVDNHSTDGTAEFLETVGGDVQVLRNATNLGFAKACNQGARAARGKHLVFLNNDTIPKAGWLDPLIQEVYSHDDVAVVGSKLLYPNNTIQHAGVVISRLYQTPYHLFLGFPENLPAVNTRREFQVVTAACMLVRKETFEEVGGFDESFVNGFEDVDLCLKIRQLGKKVVYQPKSCLYHLESQTPGRKTHDAANADRLLARWEHQWLVDEDIMAEQCGYFIQQNIFEGKIRSQFVPKQTMANSTAWQRVVDLQKLLLGQPCQPLVDMPNNQKVFNLLVPVEEWPNDIGILEWAGRVCGILDCEQEAVKFWEKLLAMGDHPNTRLRLARVMLKHGKLDEAQRHLDALKHNFSPREEGWTLQGILSMQRQEYSDAKHAFEEALTLDGESKKARIGLGMACLGLDQPAAAWESFEQALSIDPDNLEAIRCLLQAGTALQRWEVLSTHLARFIDRNPANCDIRFALAGVQFRDGQIQKANEHLIWLRLVQPEYAGLEDLERLLATPQDQSNLLSVP